MSTPVRTYARKRFALSLLSSNTIPCALDTGNSQESSQEASCYSSQETLLDDIYESSSHRTLLEEDEFSIPTPIEPSPIKSVITSIKKKKADVFDDFDALPKRMPSIKKDLKRRKLEKSDIIEKVIYRTKMIVRDLW
jgi:hypothetical protein